MRFVFSSRRRHTRCALVTGVQTCALPISVVVAATQASKGPPRGRPVRTMVYLDPPTAKVLDQAASNEGVLRVLHVLHGSLMVPGVGRKIVGWLGVAMMISAFTGIWLWRSEEHTSELQSLMRISYAVFCLKKKHKNT